MFGHLDRRERVGHHDRASAATNGGHTRAAPDERKRQPFSRRSMNGTAFRPLGIGARSRATRIGHLIQNLDREVALPRISGAEQSVEKLNILAAEPRQLLRKTDRDRSRLRRQENACV